MFIAREPTKTFAAGAGGLPVVAIDSVAPPERGASLELLPMNMSLLRREKRVDLFYLRRASYCAINSGDRFFKSS
jgi:hypothetical protein